MSNSSFYSQSGGNEATANSIQTKVNEAEDAKVAAEAAQAAAEAAQGYAETAQTRAETAETNAEASETSASGSATTATTKAAEASTSATNAAASATTATTQASAAATSATNAATSASTASTKATEAATSATTASTEATAAATSASSASTSATTATTKASEASTSATAAAASEADAEDHKDDAQKLATHAEDSQYTLSDGSTTGYSALHYNEKASDSATAAAASETAAASSATSASTSASTATTKASEASTSASSASTSASTATTKASEASTSATSAASSEADAQDHRDDAQKLATNAEDSQYTLSDGSTTGYSALHYKEKAADSAAAAAASETAAAGSATSASSSSTTATTKASEASTSASTATTKASEASSSASSAASAQTAAEAARDSALAALDSFDDRYLGVKSSAPSQDNDGNSLVSGSLYFDSTSNAMKVYDGSQWLNAYASLSGALIANQNLSDLNNAATARTNLGISTVGATGAFSDLTGTPTTVSGYGITDAFDGAFSSLSGKPTTVSGYGITDAFDGAFSSLTGKPTTVSGYGITDAFDGAYSSLTGTPTIPSATSDLTNDSGFITSADGGNAATLDSLDSTQFLRSDANDTFTGTLTTGELQIFSSHPVHTGYSGIANTEAWTTTTEQYLIVSAGTDTYINGDSVYIRGGNNSTTNQFRVTTSGSTIGGNTVWHAGNDGSGSGLDADTVDGIQASSFLRSDADDVTTGRLTVDNHLLVQNNNVSGQGDNNTHFNYQNNGTNYIRGTNTIVSSSLSVAGLLSNTGGSKLEVQNATDGGQNHGIYVWNSDDANWVIYMSQAGSGRAANGGTACSGLDGRTSHAIRYRVNDSDTQAGHIFENASNECLFQIQPDTGNVYVGGNVYANALIDRNNTTYKVDPAGSGYGVNLGTSINMNNYEINYVGQLHFNDNVRLYDAGNNSYLNFKSGSSSPAIVLYDGNNSLKGYLYADTSGFGLLDNDGNWAIRTRTGTNSMELRCDNNIELEVATTFVQANGRFRSYQGYINNAGVDTNKQWGLSFSTADPGDGNGYALLRESGAWSHPYPDIRMNAHTGFQMRAYNGYGGVRIYRDYNDDNRIIQFNGSSHYIYKDVWMHTTTSGFYSSTNSFHLHPNTLSTYAATAIRGSRNSYGGIYDDYSGVAWMHDSGGNGGNYREATGRWYFYHNVGNGCTGFNASTTSSSYTIYSTGAIYSTGNITAYSDARMKENIVTIDSALDKVCAMRGVYYNKIDDETKARQVGVIAQEMMQPEACPEAVTYAEDVDEYGVSYGNLVGVLIEAVKELRQEVAELRSN